MRWCKMDTVKYVFIACMALVFVWGFYMDFIKKWEDNDDKNK